MSYLAIPTWPPAQQWIEPASAERLNLACQTLVAKSISIELPVRYEGNSFGYAGKAEGEILSITSVHPMREEAIGKFLDRVGTERELVDKLLKLGRRDELEYQGKIFYLRRFN